VRFVALDQQATAIDGYLVRPPGGGPHPAVVLMHGCGGLLTAAGRLSSRETDWAELLAAQGYAVLMVDSFTPRGIQRMCSSDRFDVRVYLQRPRDAYGTLQYLQRGDFRAAAAFYPASCREGAHRLPWTSPIATLVLVGELDNWTPAGPCQGLVAAAAGRGSDVRIRVYPGAYHDFDWPGLPMRARPEFRTAAGVVPVTGMDSAAREDARRQVTRFLAQHLGAIIRGHPP
jgi:dienelactone hydrolase